MTNKSIKLSFSPKEQEYIHNMSSAILSGTEDEEDYKIAKKIWPKLEELVSNKETKSKVSYHQCYYCDKTFEDRNDLDDHMIKEHNAVHFREIERGVVVRYA